MRTVDNIGQTMEHCTIDALVLKKVMTFKRFLPFVNHHEHKAFIPMSPGLSMSIFSVLLSICIPQHHVLANKWMVTRNERVKEG